MFGFGFKRPTPSPALQAGTGDWLVSKNDIYGQPGSEQESVLLLKEGHKLPAEVLPRLIELGIDPTQFDLADKPLPSSKATQQGSIPGITKPARRSIRASQRVVVAEPTHKDIERLTHCLVICGFNLGMIHPVRSENNVEWALNKYQPDIAIVDYTLGGSDNGLEKILAIAAHPPEGLEKIILTLTLGSDTREVEPGIAKICADHNIDVLLKPVNRFALNKIL